MNPYSPVRRSPIAGAWYPGNPDLLKSEINNYIDNARPPALDGEVVGLIAPHAGYFYSGVTAGYAYRCVQGKSYDVCAVFSPLHDYIPHNLLTSAHEAYATPLGEVPVDHALVADCSRRIENLTGETLQHIANDHEHSLEIQLPFLQVALGAPFRLLRAPVHHDAENRQPDGDGNRHHEHEDHHDIDSHRLLPGQAGSPRGGSCYVVHYTS